MDDRVCGQVTHSRYKTSYNGLAYYRRQDSWDQAIEWYEKYLKLVPPGSKGYEFVKDNLDYLKSELFMQEP